MNAYEALAFSYDALTYDVPYEKIAAYFETLLRNPVLRHRPFSIWRAAPDRFPCCWPRAATACWVLTVRRKC